MRGSTNTGKGTEARLRGLPERRVSELERPTVAPRCHSSGVDGSNLQREPIRHWPLSCLVHRDLQSQEPAKLRRSIARPHRAHWRRAWAAHAFRALAGLAALHRQVPDECLRCHRARTMEHSGSARCCRWHTTACAQQVQEPAERAGWLQAHGRISVLRLHLLGASSSFRSREFAIVA